ncbi:hypothetical protein RQN30_01490 [Arcanobacterium hippocoleae]
MDKIYSTTRSACSTTLDICSTAVQPDCAAEIPANPAPQTAENTQNAARRLPATRDNRRSTNLHHRREESKHGQG